MIISRAPLRVSLFGGGTDYLDYYNKFDSLVIGFAIDKYVYTIVRKTPDILPYHTFVQYSKTEIVEDNTKIQHNGIRGTLEHLNIKHGVEIATLMDVPARTGLGSSSSFVVSLLKGLYQLSDTLHNNKRYIADQAIIIERELLNEPGGIQDQIWASYGGINTISLDNKGYNVRPLATTQEFLQFFKDHTVIFYTGKQRNSFKIASSHNNLSYKHQIADLSKEALQAFHSEDLTTIGKLLDKSWLAKRGVSKIISNNTIDQLYKDLKSAGVLGCKLLGAGGSGFMFCITENKKQLLSRINLRTLNFNYDIDGGKIIYEHM